LKHDEAADLLTAYLRESLGSAEMASVREHATNCAECADALQTMNQLDALSGSWEAVLDDHPDTEVLARWVGGDGSFSIDREARIASHIRACPECATEFRLAHDSIREADSPWSVLRRWVNPTQRIEIPSLIPVGLAAALLLAILPNLFQRGEVVGPSAPPTFDLGTPTRAGAARLEFRTDAPHQLLLVDYPAAVLASRPEEPFVGAELVHAATAETIWEFVESWAVVWSPDAGVLSLLLPTEQLQSGPHRLRVIWGPEGIPDTIFEIDLVRGP